MENQKAYFELDRLLRNLTSTSIGRKQFLAIAPLLLAACAGAETGKKRYREGDNTGQKAALTPEEEAEMTRQVLPEMERDYPPIQNSEMQSYISYLGKRIVDANGLEGRPYRYNFTVVGVGYVNAFALPAGTIFVTAPLIAMADNEAELAGVIGHEIGHVEARHTAERMALAQEEEKSTWKYLLGGGVIGGILGAAAGKALCPPRDKACFSKMIAAGAAAGAAGGFLVQKYKFMANSREDEMEADRIGFRRALNAGYSKAHIGKFYEKLLQMEQEAKKGANPLVASLSDAMSTHPPSKERVKQMNELVANSSNKGPAEVTTPQFERIRKLSIEWSQSAG
jgi:predicted Zn-dependent protease